MGTFSQSETDSIQIYLLLLLMFNADSSPPPLMLLVFIKKDYTLFCMWLLLIIFCSDDDLFYIRNKMSQRCKVVCSAEEADTLFKEFHLSDIGAHAGQLKTRDAISQRFYWPGMSADIEK